MPSAQLGVQSSSSFPSDEGCPKGGVGSSASLEVYFMVNVNYFPEHEIRSEIKQKKPLLHKKEVFSK
jgi:hypothetical protein